MTMDIDASWGTATGEGTPVEPVHPSAAAFLEDWVLPQFHRRLTVSRWCEQWWLHPEAVLTITALWRSWEHVNAKAPHQEAEWLLRTLHPTLDRLTGEHSPFDGCSLYRPAQGIPGYQQPAQPGAHSPLLQQLPVAAAPDPLT